LEAKTEFVKRAAGRIDRGDWSLGLEGLWDSEEGYLGVTYVKRVERADGIMDEWNREILDGSQREAEGNPDDRNEWNVAKFGSEVGGR
jgi:hypothetical protein